jgi:hypothetical protein
MSDMMNDPKGGALQPTRTEALDKARPPWLPDRPLNRLKVARGLLHEPGTCRGIPPHGSQSGLDHHHARAPHLHRSPRSGRPVHTWSSRASNSKAISCCSASARFNASQS